MLSGYKTYITAFVVALTALVYYAGAVTTDQALAAFLFEFGVGLAALRDALGKVNKK